MSATLDFYLLARERLLNSEKTRVCKVASRHVAKCDVINLRPLDAKDPRALRSSKPWQVALQICRNAARGAGTIKDASGALIPRFDDPRFCAVRAKLATECNKLLEDLQGFELGA